MRGAGGAEVTLFGSVHLLSEGVAWKTPRLQAILDRADRLWFEIPLDPEAQGTAAAKLRDAGLLPAGETLRPLLSPKGRARLERIASKLAIPVESLDRLQPWLAEVLVSVTYFTRSGARLDLGVEHQIEVAAPATAERGAFETVEDQLAALSGGSPADQAKALEETLEEIETDPKGFDRLAAAWARGDTRAIQKEGLDDLRRDAPGAYRRIVVERNRHWVERIETLLKTPGRTFAVVGVGHLVGPDSVPALLRRDGLTVDGPH